jgi:hypothetical protein
MGRSEHVGVGAAAQAPVCPAIAGGGKSNIARILWVACEIPLAPTMTELSPLPARVPPPGGRGVGLFPSQAGAVLPLIHP